MRLSNDYQFTWYPYESENNCGSAAHLKPFNMCTDFNAFLNKISRKGFMKCTIKVAWAPSLFLIRNPSDTENPGVLINLMSWIQQRLKLTVIYEYENILGNTRRCISLILQVMDRKKISVILDAFLYMFVTEGSTLWERSTLLFTTESTWVMTQRIPLSAWFILANFFSFNLWMKFVFVYIILLILWKLTRNASSILSMITITRLFLLQSITNINCLSRKIIFVSGSFLVLHFTLLFTSRLISTLTNPPLTPKPTTLNDLVAMPVDFLYSQIESEMIQATDLRSWQQLERKRKEFNFFEMEENNYLRFLEDNFNNSRLVFTTDTMFLRYYVQNLEAVELYPKPVSSKNNSKNKYGLHIA